MIGLFLAAVFVAAAPTPGTFSDAPDRYVLSVPAGCSVKPKQSATLPAFIDCGHGFARVAITSGTTRPALQKLVNMTIGGWNDLKLIENQPGASLGGSTARIIYAEGIVGGQNSSIEMLAATHNGSWYVLIMASPGAEWTADGAKYFGKIKSSFQFTDKAVKH